MRTRLQSILFTLATLATLQLFGQDITYNETFTQFTKVTCSQRQWQNWTSFRQKLDTGVYEFSKLTISGTYASTARTCNNEQAVRQIGAALKDRKAAKITCDGFVWEVGSVDGSCKTGTTCQNEVVHFAVYPTGISSGTCLCSGSDVWVIRPTIGNANWGGVNTGACNAPTQTMQLIFNHEALTASKNKTDGYIDINWKKTTNCAKFSPPREVYLQLYDVTDDVELYKFIYEDLNNTKSITGNYRHYVKPNSTHIYELRLFEYGNGNPLCTVLTDTGSTLPHITPSISTIKAIKPEKIEIDIASASTYSNRFQLYRDGRKIAILDTGTQTYIDNVVQRDTLAIQNGKNYVYCLEGINEQTKLTSLKNCDTGSTYTVNFTASRNSYSDKVVLNWNGLSEFAKYLVIERDGNRLISLANYKNTFTDVSPIPGQKHNYTLVLTTDEGVRMRISDTGSILANGILEGYVLNKDGGFGIRNTEISIAAFVNGDSVIRKTFTDASGYYRFDKVYYHTSATYSVSARLTGSTITHNPQDATFNTKSHNVRLDFEGNLSAGLLSSGKFNIKNFSVEGKDKEDRIAIQITYDATDSIQLLLKRNNSTISSLYVGKGTNTIVTSQDLSGLPNEQYTYTLDAFSFSKGKYFKQTLYSTAKFPAVAKVPDTGLYVSPNSANGTVEIKWNHTSTNNSGVLIERNYARLTDAVQPGNGNFTDLTGKNASTTTYALRSYRVVNGVRFESPASTVLSVNYPALKTVDSLKYSITKEGFIAVSWQNQPGFDTKTYNYTGTRIIRSFSGKNDTLATVPSEGLLRFVDQNPILGKSGVQYSVHLFKRTANTGVGKAITVTDTLNLPAPLVIYSYSYGPGTIFSRWAENGSMHTDGLRVIADNDTFFYNWSYPFQGYATNRVDSVPFNARTYKVINGIYYWSPAVYWKTKANPNNSNGLPAVTNLSATQNLPDKVTLTWDYPSYYLAEFKIYSDGIYLGSVSGDARVYQDFIGANTSQLKLYSIVPFIGSKNGAAAFAYGQRIKQNRIQGIASNTQTGSGIPNAEIVVYKCVSCFSEEPQPELEISPLAKTHTDSSGYYSFSNIDLSYQSALYVGINAPGHLFELDLISLNLSEETLKGNQILVPRGSQSYTVNFSDTSKQYWENNNKISPPIAFVATVNTSNQSVELHWNAAGNNFSGFKLYRGLELIQDITRGQNRLYTDLGGAPGMDYSYRIKSYWEDEPGHVVESEFVIALATYPSLEAVSDITSTPYADYLRLNWNHINHLHSYYSISRNGKPVALVPTSENMQWDDTTGLQGQNYTYEIKAVLETSTAVFSSAGVTHKAIYPVKTKIPNMDAWSSWNHVASAFTTNSKFDDFYSLYRDGILLSRVSRGNMQLFWNSFIFIDSTGLPDITYRYEIRSGYIRQNTLSESKPVYKDVTFPKLTAPSTVSATPKAGLDKVVVTWTYNPTNGTNGYKIYRSTSLNVNLVLIGTVSGRNTLTFEDITGEPQKSYYYYISATDFRQNTPLESAKTASASVTFPILSPPTSVTGVTNSTTTTMTGNWSYTNYDDNLQFQVLNTFTYTQSDKYVVCPSFFGQPAVCQNNISTNNYNIEKNLSGNERSYTHLNYLGNVDLGNPYYSEKYCGFTAKTEVCQGTGLREYSNNKWYVRAKKTINGTTYYSNYVEFTPANPTRQKDPFIYAFSASKGTYTGQVYLNWSLKSGVAPIKTINIYRDGQLIETSDPDQTDFFDKDAIPGKKHTYSIALNYVTGGFNSQRAVSDIGYSPANGEILGAVVTSITGNGVSGVKITATAIIDKNQYKYTTYTDGEGKYVISDVYYNSKTRYTVTASYPEHQFEKESQTADLELNIEKAYVSDFRDKTAFILTGTVAMKEACTLDSMEVKLKTTYKDGTSKTESVFTTSKGVYSFVIQPSDPNLASLKLTISDTQNRGGAPGSATTYHRFNHLSKTWSTGFNAFKLITTYDFLDTTVYPVQFQIENTCGLIGKYKFIVHVEDASGCYRKSFQTLDNGRLSVSLPPLDLKIVVGGVVPENPSVASIVDYLSVRPIKLNLLDTQYMANGYTKLIANSYSGKRIPVRMVYHKSPKISVSGVSKYLCDDVNSAYLLKQGEKAKLKLAVFETHNGTDCYVNMGYLVIKNDGATKTKDTIYYNAKVPGGGFKDYEFTVGAPMTVAPYFRQMFIEYHTTSDGFLGDFNKQMLIEGSAAQPGNDIIVTNDGQNNFQIPLMVLRDPPGDQSYSYIEKGTTFTRTLNISDDNSGFGGVKTENEFKILGVGAAFDLEIKAGGGTGNEASYAISVTTKQRIQTAEDNSVANADNTGFLIGDAADIIVGSGVALKYGISERITVDPLTCAVTKTSVVAISLDKVKTTWIYTVDQIRKLIKDFRNDSANTHLGKYVQEGKTADQTRLFLRSQILNWESVLRYHFYENIPYIQLCNKDNQADLPEPYKTQLGEWTSKGFCKDIGTYVNVAGKEKFVPNNPIKWTDAIIEKYNKIGQISRDLTSSEFQFKFKDGLIWSEAALNNLNIDAGYKQLYGADAENFTFSGNTNLEKSVTVSRTQNRGFSQYWSMDVEGFFGVSIKQDITVMTLAGMGVVVGTSKKLVDWDTKTGAIAGYHHEYKRSESNETVEENTTGYVLTDNDAGDQFSVTVFRGNDPMQTPYFALVGGRSSCPVEPGTIPRDRPLITLEDIDGRGYNDVQRDLDPSKPFLMPIKLSNLASEIFNENRYFKVESQQNYNRYNATMRVSGNTLGAAEFLIPSGGSVYSYLEVTRPAGYYNLNDLAIGLTASCPNNADPDNYSGYVKTMEFYFRQPCSNISILSPGNNWIIKKANPSVVGDADEKLQVKIGDYDLDNPYLQDVTLQYRRIGSNAWVDIATLTKAELQTYYDDNKTTYRYPTYPFAWDIKSNALIIDGDYELRAKSFCGISGIVISNVITGRIDRSNISIFGLPQPADGLLSLGDETSVTFNKEILCDLNGAKYKFYNAADSSVIPATATCFGNKIVFAFTQTPAELDGIKVLASLENVKDLSENDLSSPIQWSFTIVNNPLFFNPQSLEMQAYSGSTVKVPVSLINTQDVEFNYALTLSGSSWLSATPINGTVIRSSFKELSVTMNTSGLTPGQTYYDTIFADVSSFSRLKLPVKFTVVAKPVNWTFDPTKYSGNATVICNYNFDSTNIFSKDTMDRIAAFIDGEVRGYTNIVKTGNYYRAYLNVAGNPGDEGKQVRFFVWNATTGIEYAATSRGIVNYQNNGFFGTTPAPRILDVRSSADSVRYIPLRSGWNYLALNTQQKDMSLDNMLMGLKPSEGDILKTLTSSAHFNATSGKWLALSGGLNTINTDNGYLLFLQKQDTLKAVGNPAEVNTTTLNKGWNLIGNPYAYNTNINSAFLGSGLSNLAKIKNDNQAGDYDSASKAWNGITNLVVNKSYMLNNGKTGLLVRNRAADFNCTDLVTNGFEHSITFLGVVKLNGSEIQSDDYLVRAFVGDECRGTGKLEYVPATGRFMLNLFAYSNNPGEKMGIRIYHISANKWYDVPDSVGFNTDYVFGTPSNPYVFSNLNDVLNVKPLSEKASLQVWPNPFDHKIEVKFTTNTQSELSVKLYDVTGKLIISKSFKSSAGDNYLKINTENYNLAQGIYYLNVSGDNTNSTFKLLKVD